MFKYLSNKFPCLFVMLVMSVFCQCRFFPRRLVPVSFLPLSLSLSGQAPPKPIMPPIVAWGEQRRSGEETTSCQIPRGPFSGTGGTRLILKGTVQNFLTLAKSALGFHEMKKNLTKLLFEDRRDLLTFFENIFFIHLFLGVETIRWFSLLSP